MTDGIGSKACILLSPVITIAGSLLVLVFVSEAWECVWNGANFPQNLLSVWLMVVF